VSVGFDGFWDGATEAAGAAESPYAFIDELRDLKKPARIEGMRPDGNGGLIEVRSEPGGKENYTAHHYANGMMQVRWEDGREMVRFTDADGATRTTMTGPKPFQNFEAEERGSHRQVRYADGSGLDSDGGNQKVFGRYGGTGNADLMGSAANYYVNTLWSLKAAADMQRKPLAMAG
jgi:hypothetical protein